ncbi:MAG: VirB8/TrbF family protein [Bacteriovoracia bacterium]
MIRNIQRKYFEVWGEEEAQNVFLKWLLLIVSTLLVSAITALLILALRKPVLIGIEKEDTKVFQVAPPSPELLKQELVRTLKEYVQRHYTWDAQTVEKAHVDASKYVSERYQKAFQAANADQVRMAKEKKVKQTVHIVDLYVDTKALKSRINLDRILSVEGVRAVTSLVLDISFEYGPRTENNPEGIYIVSENNITPQNGG